VLFTGHVIKEPGLSCVIGRSSILHYGPLIKTNNLYSPTPNGQNAKNNEALLLLEKINLQRDFSSVGYMTVWQWF